MRPQLARLGKQTLIYGVGGVLLPLVGLLTLPVFARVFQTDEYGVIDLVTVAMAVAALLVDAGLASALQRSYFDYPEGAESRRTVVFTAVVTSLGLSLVFAALIILFRGTLADWLFGDAGYGDALAIAALNLPVATAAALARQIMRLRFQPWRFLISSTLGALVGAGAAVTAVVVFRPRGEGRVCRHPRGQPGGACLRGDRGPASRRPAVLPPRAARDAGLWPPADPHGAGNVGAAVP